MNSHTLSVQVVYFSQQLQLNVREWWKWCKWSRCAIVHMFIAMPNPQYSWEWQHCLEELVTVLLLQVLK